MDVVTPDWLTRDFIQSALEEKINGIIITDIVVKRAVPKGTNFMCDLFRVNVCYQLENNQNVLDNEHKISVIVKAPISGGLNEYVFDFGIIQKEMVIYDIYLPKLKHILKTNITPISYKCSRENVLVLEDLNFIGFKMVDRLLQLDFDHCKMCLIALGKYHAASIKLQEENPGLLDTIGKESMFRTDLKTKFEFLPQAQIDLHIIEISTWPELKDYIKPLSKLREKIWDLLTVMFESNEDEFRVLNHGDFWVTNFLFKYDKNGKPEDIRFLDLQLTRYTSPAVDLIYFFQGSVQEHIRRDKYYELLDIYLESLNTNLTEFNCKTLKLEEMELRRALKKREFQEFYTNITLVPVVINDAKEDKVMEIREMTEKDIKENIANNPFRRYLQTERYRKLFTERFINEFVKHEWFYDLSINV